MSNLKQMLSKAIQIAVNAHDGQFDKGGSPYILHPLKVMHYLKSTDEELMCVAVLHDVLEDTDVVLGQLRDLGMSQRVLDAVYALTKRDGQKDEEYLNAILANQDAMLVKMADLRHNMDIRRLKGIREKDLTRLGKYAVMYSTIQKHLQEI